MSWRVLGRQLSKCHLIFIRQNTICTIQVSHFFMSRHHLSESSVNKALTPALTNVEKGFQEKVFTEAGESTTEDKDTSIRNMKYTFAFLGLTFVAVGSYVFLVLGKPPENDNGELVSDEFSNLPVWQQYFKRGIKQVEKFAVFIQEPSRDKLLPDPLVYPYYQPPYTLVLEFTDVLAHPEWTYQTGWRFKKRPGVDYMLENLAGLYEIVIFTAEPGMTIFPVIEALDQRGLISYKLVRDSTHFIDGQHVKNLERLNRDLSKVIVVDWDAQALKFNNENHFALDRWKGNDDDSALVELTSFLKTIAQTEIEDVREVLKFYKQFDDPLAIFKQKQLEFLEMQKQLQEKPLSQPKDSMKRLFNVLL